MEDTKELTVEEIDDKIAELESQRRQLLNNNICKGLPNKTVTIIWNHKPYECILVATTCSWREFPFYLGVIKELGIELFRYVNEDYWYLTVNKFGAGNCCCEDGADLQKAVNLVYDHYEGVYKTLYDWLNM
jgi:hypothetical protein